ncbi:MAG TPA: M3 family metallopeptidase [Thermoanaerobaculaceae bacterium]|nr:M3 family metallopeptidase [Thermoanaerobaculaceae bacterium]
MRKWLVVAIVAAVTFPALAAQQAVAPQSQAPPAAAQAAPAADANPFFAEWTTPFGVPPFGMIKDAHFLPAFQEGIARKRAEVDAIVQSGEAPTFANTVAALDAAGDFLDRVQTVFFGLSSAETTDALQRIAKEVSPQLSALNDDINLNEALFARVRAVWETRNALELDREQRKLVDDTYKDLVRGGANLDREGRTRLRAINRELALEGLKFADNLLKETNAFRLVVERKEDLAGLPPGVVSAAAETAKSAKLEGKWVFTLQAPSIWPFLQYADNRELRRQILTGYITRCDHGDASDNKAVLAKIAALRAEKARLLGFATWADFVLDRNMAKKPEKVYGLLDQVWTPALRVAHREAADLQAAIKADGKEFKLEPWDWRYYSEKVKKARFDFDEEALRPYLELDHVREGAFFVANKLYGITFTERTDIPKYHPEVRTFEVKDADGSFLGVFMTDYHPRAGKRGGAWSGRYRDQFVRDGKDIRPIVVNVCNFSRPTADTPALLSLEEAETLFHEFGHALNSLVSRVHYHGSARVPRDFVELPSQIMENWVLEPEVLKAYAKHWKTGEAIPAALVAKVEKARQFGQGFASVEYIEASYLDMDWHTIADTKERDATAFENATLARIHAMPEIVVRYRSPYFAHIFGPGGGYSAGYYSYIWAEVLVADAFQAFKENGIFDKATAASFRANILERPGTDDAMAGYVRFRGHEPSVEPLLVKRGLK